MYILEGRNLGMRKRERNRIETVHSVLLWAVLRVALGQCSWANVLSANTEFMVAVKKCQLRTSKCVKRDYITWIRRTTYPPKKNHTHTHTQKDAETAGETGCNNYEQRKNISFAGVTMENMRECENMESSSGNITPDTSEFKRVYLCMFRKGTRKIENQNIQNVLFA